MRNFKKFLALVLAMLMVVSAAATVSAFEDVAEDNQFAEAIADLTVLDIVNGYDGETFGPEDAVTRQQFALMMARAITGITDDAEWAKGGLVAFDDVAEYQYAIATVVKAGIVDGFLDNTFRPEEGVTFIQALKMAVCALGYGEGLEWWQGYYNVALDLGLTDNLNQITDKDQALNRGEVAQLVWNMLYAPAANGSSLAYDIFGIGVEEPVVEPATEDTLVVTATTKQYATENIEVAEGGKLGVQALINGVPAGEVYYIDIEEFGFADDAEAEAAYLKAYNFYNWNAEDETFDGIDLFTTEEKMHVITNADVTSNYTTSNKLKIEGVVYYPVEEVTDSKIKNEIVVFSANDHLYTHTKKTLAVEVDGSVWGYADFDGDGVKTFGKVLSAGKVGDEIVYFRDLVDNKILDYDAAVAKYGNDVESEYENSLEFLTVNDLIDTKAYQMTLYNDDLDEEYERAYVTPIYVSAHDDTTNSNGWYEYGPMKNDTADANDSGKKDNYIPVTWIDVEGNEVDLAHGEVYKYIYNEQLNQVTVLDTYASEKGVINRIYTGYDTKTYDYEVIVTIDGVDYILGNTYREALGLDGFSIPDAVTVKAIKDLANDGKTSKIGYTYNSVEVDKTFKNKNYVEFVAIDGVIILMEVVADDANFSLALFEDFVTFDTDALYLELWVNGVVDEYEITRVQKKNGKYADYADLSLRDQMDITNYFLDERYISKGDVLKLIATEDGYALSRAMDDMVVDAEGNVNVKSEKTNSDGKVTTNDYKLAWFDNDHKVVFEDGIGDMYTKNDQYAIQTSNSTLFYFVNTAAKTVDTYKGTPKDGWYIDNDDTTIYADKLGFSVSTNAIAGTASVVVVYYDERSDIGGFSISGLESKLVYVTTKYDNFAGYLGWDRDYYNAYENKTGFELDLDRQYWDEDFYYYNLTVGIDLLTGKAVSGIYVNEDADLKPGYVYWMTEDDIILDDGIALANAVTDAEYSDTIKLAKDIKTTLVADGRYKTTKIPALAGEKFATLAVMNGDDTAIKTSVTDINKLVATAQNVYYVVNEGTASDYNESFVAVLVDTPDDTNNYASYNGTANRLTVTGGEDGVLDAVTFAFVDTSVFDPAKVTNVTIAIAKDRAGNPVTLPTGYTVDSNVASGKLTIDVGVDTFTGRDYVDLEAGHTYEITVNFTVPGSGTRSIVWQVTVPAAN